MDKPYTIRQATSADWRTWKALRLEALQADPEICISTFSKESTYGDDVWVSGLENPDRGAFLLFHDQEAIGLTVIRRSADFPQEASLHISYIRKEHRRKGLSRLLYQARIDWAHAHGIDKLTLSFREGNKASEAACRKFGFVFAHQEMTTWPDGKTDPDIYYALNLKSAP